MVYLVRNKDDLDQQLALAEDKLVVIDFYANWCGPCKIIAPKLEELAQQYLDRAVVLKVNVDDNEDITVEYNLVALRQLLELVHVDLEDHGLGGVLPGQRLHRALHILAGTAPCGVEIEDNQLVVRRLDPLVVVVHGADRSHFHGFTEEITGFKGVI